jgi:Family of unknown function (DUF6152)
MKLLKNLLMAGAVSAGLFATLTSVQAHHSFSASYDLEKTFEIKGKLVQLNFRNPHSSVMVLAPDANGVEQRWGIEWGGATALQRQGMTRDSFKIGDQVVISGQPSRTPEDHRLRMLTIRRTSDNFGWGQNGEAFD